MKTQLALIVCAGVFTFGCGGSASSSTGAGAGNNGASQPAVAVQGAYSGTESPSSGTPLSLIGAFLPGGDGFFVEEGGGYYLLPPFSTDGTLDGTIPFFLGPGQSCPCSPPNFTAALTASGNPATSITGTASDSLGSDSISMSAIAPAPMTLGDVAGTYADIESTVGGLASVTISPSGAISGSDGFGCQISGTASIVDSGALLSITMTDGTKGDYCLGAASGFAFPASTDFLDVKSLTGSDGPYLYLGAYNSTNGLLLELAKQ